MNNLIISPHTDDAIFSLGDFIGQLDNVTVLSPFAGIPTDNPGRKKHLKLREEHTQACHELGIKFINGPFLDDVYPPTDYKEIVNWLATIIPAYDQIIVPLGIFHKDHVLLRDILLNEFRVDAFYAELPYRVAFPAITEVLIERYAKKRRVFTCQTGEKESACKKYESQNGGPVMSQVMVEERLYI